MSEERFTRLMLHTGQLIMDVGTVLTGADAVKEGLIDTLGTLSDALDWLYEAIEQHQRPRAAGPDKAAGQAGH